MPTLALRRTAMLLLCTLSGAALALPGEPAVQPKANLQERSLPSPQMQGPAWPQKFELLAGDGISYGVPVALPAGRAGAVAVTVQTQGAPVVVSLLSQDGRVLARREGTGQLLLEHPVVPQDLAAGPAWSVLIQLAAPPPQAAPRQVLATGSVSVNAPWADQATLQKAIQTSAQRVQLKQAQRAQALTGEVAGVSSAFAQQLQADAARQAAARQQSQRAALDARFPVQPQAATSRFEPVGKPRAPTMSKTQPAGNAVPSTSAQTAPSFNPDKAEGDPGTPVNLAGAALGATPGEVHFVVANGRDLVAPVDFWSDAQVRIRVPDVEGVATYDGVIYVRRADGTTSAYRPFRFLPRLKTVMLGITPNPHAPTAILDANLALDCMARRQQCYKDTDLFFGAKGDDEFFVNTRMTNGWVVQAPLLYGSDNPQVSPRPQVIGVGGINVAEVRVGTNSPYLRVHWWLGILSHLTYGPGVIVVGPAGLPCGVALADGSDACMH